MILIQMKKLIILLMSAVAFISAIFPKETADSYLGHDFPLISVEAQAADTVRIMSFNIRCADVNGVPVEDRLDIGMRQILEVLPDSLGIQEATGEWMQALHLGLLPYGWVGVERDAGGDPRKGGESCPIFYLKTKYLLVDSGNFWLSETPDEPSFGPGAACRRICTWAKLRNRKTGETYFHVNTHYDHVSEAARAAGAEIVMRFIEEHCAGFPVVFTADMNALNTETAYSTMTATLKDAAAVAENAVSFGTYHGCSPETHANAVIDYILCSDSTQVLNYRVITKGIDHRFVSDHFPIYADMKMASVKTGGIC